MTARDKSAEQNRYERACDREADLKKECESLRKANGLLRSFVAGLSEQLLTKENDPFVGVSEAEGRLRVWESWGTGRWGLGVALDVIQLQRRVEALERKVLS